MRAGLTNHANDTDLTANFLSKGKRDERNGSKPDGR